MIIGLTGKNGSGKGEVAKYLLDRGFVYYSLSDVLREEASKEGKPLTREVLVALGNQLRSQHGPSVLAEKIFCRLDPEKHYVIDSIRHPSEVQVFRRRVDFVLACVRAPERLSVCLDTAHVFAAGYDISSEAGTRKTFRHFDNVIGLERLAALHLNDSKTVRGSRVDRHQHIGEGKIGLDAFRFIMRDRRFRKIPKVLETPKGKELHEDVQNMKTLRELMK